MSETNGTVATRSEESVKATGVGTARPAARGFLAEFIRKPFEIGAIAPSSVHLARKMVEGVDFSKVKQIVEFGPGTGVFTQQIAARMSATTGYFAIEINALMVERYRARFPRLRIHQDSVANVAGLCAQEGVKPGGVDAIFSGLPWASFPDALQDDTLKGVIDVLRPGGELITFGYHIGTVLAAGKRFYKRLPQVFSKVTRSEYVWRNLPPAFVVRCVK